MSDENKSVVIICCKTYKFELVMSKAQIDSSLEKLQGGAGSYIDFKGRMNDADMNALEYWINAESIEGVDIREINGL